MEKDLQKKTIRVKYVDFWDSDAKPFYKELSQFYNVELSDEPDYVFFGVHDGHGGYGESHLTYNNCIKILYTLECFAPDFNLCDYAMGYDYISLGDRYLRWPSWYMCEILHVNLRKMALLMQKKHENIEGILSRKTDFCSFIVSNGAADPIRQAAFEALSSYKRVNSGGRFLNNIGLPPGVGVADKLEFQKKHKFSLAFENCAFPGYTSEKLIDAFAAQTVPIYWGDPTIKETFNPKAFIDASDFDSLESLVDYVKKVDEDDELYMEMLRQPALLNRSDYVEEQQLVLEAFLRNIFDQDKEKAFRRNMQHWGALYQDDRLKNYMRTRIYRCMHSIFRATKEATRKRIVAITGEKFVRSVMGKLRE